MSKNPVISVKVDGTKEWQVDGKSHRLDGPAIEWNDGSKEWLIEDQEISEDHFNHVKDLPIEEIRTILAIVK